MTWMIKPAVADEIIRIRAQFLTMPATTVAVLGVQLDRLAWAGFERDMLGTADIPSSPSELLSALSKRLASAPEIDSRLTKLFAGCRMDQVTHGLCRFLGVDPLGLAVLGACANSLSARSGQQAIDLTFTPAKAEKQAPALIEGAIRLSKQVLWRAGKLTIRQAVLPRSLMIALPGTTVDRVIEHPWDGWKSISITKVVRTKTATTLVTDARGDAMILT